MVYLSQNQHFLDMNEMSVTTVDSLIGLDKKEEIHLDITNYLLKKNIK